MTNPEDILGQVPIFSMLSKRDINRLIRDIHDRTFPAGTVLTEEEEYGTLFTVIVDGGATVSVHGKPVRHLQAGDFFGEMGLIDRSPRSATVTADTEVRCLMLSQTVFRPFAMFHPETMWALLELMVQRVRDVEARSSDG